MDISIVVNIILCILSFILAAVSVVTVVITLRQNHKMIENSTRPYVAIYSRVTNFQEPFYYLVLKNFGQSKAKITGFSCNVNLKEFSKDPNQVPFQHIITTEIMPHQSFVCVLDRLKLCGHVNVLNFDISYIAGVKKYSESFCINVETDIELVSSRGATPGKELRNISYTLQDLVEKIM